MFLGEYSMLNVTKHLQALDKFLNVPSIFLSKKLGGTQKVLHYVVSPVRTDKDCFRFPCEFKQILS